MRSKQKIEVFIYYPIKAIKPCFEESLYQYLFDNVWGIRGDVEEDIRVMNEYDLKKNAPINVVRYQFGDFYNAEEYMDEIGEEIEKYFAQWISLNSNMGTSIFA